MRSYTITTVAEFEAALAENTIPETKLVSGCGPRTRFNEAKRLGVVQELSEFSRENRWHADVLVTPEMAEAILGIKECEASDDWDFYLGAKSERTYYHFDRNNRNRKFSETNLGSLRKGMLRDAVNGNFIYGPQANIDCYGGCSNLQHRCLLVLKMKAMGVENPAIWLSVDGGHHPTTNSKYDRPKVHKLHDDLFKSGEYFTRAMFEAECEYLPEVFDIRKTQDDLLKTTVTVLNNLYGRLHCSGFTASYHPGGSQAPNDDDLCDMLDCVDLDAFQAMLIRLHEAEKGEDGKKRAWPSKLAPAMVATACVLASNRDHEDKTNIKVDLSVVSLVIENLARTADAGDDGFSPLVVDIARYNKKGSTMTDKTRRIFAGLVTCIKCLLDDEPFPSDIVPNGTDTGKMKKGKMGWPLFGGIDQPEEPEAKDE